MIRIGHGFDAHRFTPATPSKPLVLGGVSIPFDRALEAHSDGDVLIHALCDALLGAAGEGDIGRHFPDQDAAYAGIDSRVLLRKVMALVRQRGLGLGNADITVIAQVPKLGPHIQAMRANLAADLETTPGQVNIKATTTERMGYAGREEGISSHAVVLLCPANREQP